jgi:hypothetical protein
MDAEEWTPSPNHQRENAAQTALPGSDEERTPSWRYPREQSEQTPIQDQKQPKGQRTLSQQRAEPTSMIFQGSSRNPVELERRGADSCHPLQGQPSA